MSKRFKVLIADDEYWTREKLRKMIEWEEYGLELLPMACDGEEVLARIEQQKPDILITDINMPFLNGVELLKKVQEAHRDVVTFVISGYNDFEYVKGAFLAGSINYLVKPVSKIDLVHAIVKALELISERKSKKEQEEQKKQELSKAASLMQDREFSQFLEYREMMPAPHVMFEPSMEYAGLSLILIKIHNTACLMKECGYDMNLISMKIKNRIREMTGSGALMIFNYIYRSNEFIMITELEHEELEQLLQRLLEELCSWVNSPLTIVAGERSYSLDSIHQAYVQAVSMLMTRKFTADSCLIWCGLEHTINGSEVKSRFSEVQAKELLILLKSAMLFAVALDSGIKAQKVYRTALFIPCLISAVIVGFVWLKMFSNVLPAVNDFLGTNFNFLLFGDPKTVLGGLLIANNWQWIGYWMLIYLAGLQSVPAELYEAAKVDGAGFVKRFFNVTIPMLAPAITICIVGITTGSLKVYDLLVSSTKGGPGRASTSVIYKTYTTAINGRQYGYGSAMTVTLIMALLLVSLIQVKGLKSREVQA